MLPNSSTKYQKAWVANYACNYHLMKSVPTLFRILRSTSSLALGLSVGNVVWGAPAIQSIDVSPTPLATGQPFTISVTASPDVVQATATVVIQLTENGGPGDDVLTGSAGPDVLLGGDWG